MNKVRLTLAVLLVAFAISVYASSASHSKSIDEHTQWIAESLKEMQTIKVGVARADLLKVFAEEGGISTRSQRRYVYRECRYIKVDVKFEPTSTPEEKLTEHPEDRIIEISKPFLEWSITD
jgi:hypothetical protein